MMMIALKVKKTRMMGYSTVTREKFGDIFSRLDTIDQRDRQTLSDSKDRAYA